MFDFLGTGGRMMTDPEIYMFWMAFIGLSVSFLAAAGLMADARVKSQRAARIGEDDNHVLGAAPAEPLRSIFGFGKQFAETAASLRADIEVFR
ncbi:MAG: hypothetical protein CL945_05150, partial [Dinoroseobacter sp.]|nr:hypothetical protein [Dinoroseobacter sp.]